MKLTTILLHLRRQIIPGHRLRGKHRKRHDPPPQEMARLRNEFEIQETSMFYLRKPYFSQEQDNLYQKLFAVDDARTQDKEIRSKIDGWVRDHPHRAMEDMFLHLRVSEKWE